MRVRGQIQTERRSNGRLKTALAQSIKLQVSRNSPASVWCDALHTHTL